VLVLVKVFCGQVFGGRTTAWVLAIIVQGLFFGFAHAYQGLNGIIITAIGGMVIGSTYLLAGRKIRCQAGACKTLSYICRAL
jgi:hypothetical protein